LVDSNRQIYEEIEKESPVSKNYSPTIKFSFVKPESAPFAEDDFDFSIHSSPFEYVVNEYPTLDQKPLAVYFPALDCFGLLWNIR